jgi:hypothetical protein
MQIFTLDVYFREKSVATRLVAIAESYEQATLEIYALAKYRLSIEKVTVVSSVFISKHTTVYRLDDNNQDMFKFNINPFNHFELE